MASDKERIATLEANHMNYARTQDAIFQYMKDGRGQREEMLTQLSIVADNVQSIKEDNTACNQERKNLILDMADVKGFQSRTMKVASGIAAIMALAVTSSVEWFRR